MITGILIVFAKFFYLGSCNFLFYLGSCNFLFRFVLPLCRVTNAEEARTAAVVGKTRPARGLGVPDLPQDLLQQKQLRRPPDHAHATTKALPLRHMQQVLLVAQQRLRTQAEDTQRPVQPRSQERGQ